MKRITLYTNEMGLYLYNTRKVFWASINKLSGKDLAFTVEEDDVECIEGSRLYKVGIFDSIEWIKED